MANSYTNKNQLLRQRRLQDPNSPTSLPCTHNKSPLKRTQGTRLSMTKEAQVRRACRAWQARRTGRGKAWALNQVNMCLWECPEVLYTQQRLPRPLAKPLYLN
ncbi:hypothetical protein E2C01_072984 [Portunus trituberculatus]|uniref:Uncharacterized protein n=1 Tax=Portunus trituberculatus TaxID=210409 RepID=A0A5B7IAF8_PORTR|nr:hypothetical protein [Portunus trituberculatus]